MRLLPGRGAWARWDWPTRFGVVTGVAGLTASAVAMGFWLFGVDVGETVRSAVQALVITKADPWEMANMAEAERTQDETRRMSEEIVARLKRADLSGAIDYHATIGEPRCYQDETYLELMKVRFAIAQFLYNDEENPIANNVYNKNPDLQPFLRNDRANKLLSAWRHISSGGAQVSIREDLDLKLFARTLLDYYGKITATPDWEEKFETLDPGHMGGKYWRKGLHQPYVAAGFPATADYCMNNYSFAFSLDTYLYSFWWRRWREGVMEASRLVLEAFLEMRIFAVPALDGG